MIPFDKSTIFVCTHPANVFRGPEEGVMNWMAVAGQHLIRKRGSVLCHIMTSSTAIIQKITSITTQTISLGFTV
ncbi:hypothetical protein KIN20_020383 [Parelaphostrongylus tenuis]|uniref:Uncharacterized protein n=1 Tax=Parelaphostrongylus tenuis TaxID=148309 RepID=A0AAD5MST1_PARTN|nr:hypothetical protein KIN20_020383 [Parelaphostrongylus tenuis]